MVSLRWTARPLSLRGQAKKEVGRCPVQFYVLVLHRVGMRGQGMAPGDGGC